MSLGTSEKIGMTVSAIVIIVAGIGIGYIVIYGIIQIIDYILFMKSLILLLLLLPASIIAIIYWLRTKRRTAPHTHKWFDIDRVEVTSQGQDYLGYRVWRSFQGCSCCSLRVVDYYRDKYNLDKEPEKEVLIKYLSPKC